MWKTGCLISGTCFFCRSEMLRNAGSDVAGFLRPKLLIRLVYHATCMDPIWIPFPQCEAIASRCFPRPRELTPACRRSIWAEQAREMDVIVTWRQTNAERLVSSQVDLSCVMCSIYHVGSGVPACSCVGHLAGKLQRRKELHVPPPSHSKAKPVLQLNTPH